MALIALDTNTISYYFRGDAQVVPRLQALRPADVAVPAIVEYELRYGLLRLPPESAAPAWRPWRNCCNRCSACRLTLNAPSRRHKSARRWRQRARRSAHIIPFLFH